MRKQALDQWIQEAITDTDKNGKCTALALVHMVGVIEKEIHARKLPDKIALDSIFEMAEMFRGKAQSYAEGLAGAQQFQMLAFYADRKQAQGFYPFMEQGYTQMEGLATEGPTPQGLLQQMMRHNEVMTQSYVRKDAILMEYMGKMIEQQANIIFQTRRENIESFGMVKELILALSVQKHDRRMEELTYERETSQRDALYKVVPALINGATGREVIPQSNADTSLVEMLIDKVAKKGPAALQVLSQLELDGPSMMALATRIEQGMKARALAEHAKSANGVDIDGESDVNGGALQ
jgi:hypothetical protein